MNKLMIAVAASLMAVALFAEDAKPARPKLTEAERKARREQHQKLRAQRLLEAGGLVTQPSEGRALRVFNAQSAVSSDVAARAIGRLQDAAVIQMAVQDITPAATPFETADAALKTPKTGAAVILANAGKLPTVLVAPEKCYVIVNIDALGEDLPPKAVLESRVEKEIVRACVWVLGSGEALQPGPCVMKHAPTIAALDANNLRLPSPDPLMRMMNGAITRNIDQLRRSTYRKACEEGWAPAPTNDAQKAVWNKVHELPTNPLPLVKPAK